MVAMSIGIDGGIINFASTRHVFIFWFQGGHEPQSSHDGSQYVIYMHSNSGHLQDHHCARHKYGRLEVGRIDSSLLC